MENLKQDILKDMKGAMKEKNTSKLEALRAMKGAIDKFEKENTIPEVELSNANYVTALKPLVKQRMDSIEQFKAAGNEELTNKEQIELDVINIYLSRVLQKQMTTDEIIMHINALGYSSVRDMGKVMSYFKSNYEGQYDGKELSTLVKQILK